MPVSEPERAYSSPNRQSCELPRCGPQDAHPSYRGTHAFHPVHNLFLPVLPSDKSHRAKTFFFYFSLRASFPLFQHISFQITSIPSHETNEYPFKHSQGLDYMRANGHADIVCRVYSSTNTSNYYVALRFVSQASYERQRRCVSRLCPTSSLASSYSSVGSAQTVWAFGRRRQLGRLRRMARRSGQRSLVSMWFARPIVRCYACWGEEGSKLSNLRIAGICVFFSFHSFILPFFLPSFGLYVSNGIRIQRYWCNTVLMVRPARKLAFFGVFKFVLCFETRPSISA